MNPRIGRPAVRRSRLSRQVTSNDDVPHALADQVQLVDLRKTSDYARQALGMFIDAAAGARVLHVEDCVATHLIQVVAQEFHGLAATQTVQENDAFPS